MISCRVARQVRTGHCRATANQPTFRSITFSAGVNIILADRSPTATNKDTTNALGKSTLIAIIDFCLGSSLGAGLRAEALSEWSFTLDLTLAGKRISVTRSVASPGFVSFEGSAGPRAGALPRAMDQERTMHGRAITPQVTPCLVEKKNVTQAMEPQTMAEAVDCAVEDQAAFDLLGPLTRKAMKESAVTTGARSEALPDLPTLTDFLPGYEASFWGGFCAPKDTPVQIVDKLNSEINVALADPKIKARLADLGATVLPGSPADFGKLIAEETEKWAKVVKFAGIKPD